MKFWSFSNMTSLVKNWFYVECTSKLYFICSVILWLLVFCWYILWNRCSLRLLEQSKKKCVGVVSFGGEHWTEAQHEAGAFRGCPVIISQSTFEVSKIELKVDFQFKFSLTDNPEKKFPALKIFYFFSKNSINFLGRSNCNPK